MRNESKSSAGYSLAELLVSVAIIGVITLLAMAGWSQYQKRATIKATTGVMRAMIMRARYLAISKDTNHFLVIDPQNSVIKIYEDTALPKGSFTTADTLIATQPYPKAVKLALPASPSPLPNPLNPASNMASAWGIAAPDSTAAWGTTLEGFMETPSGSFMSAEATPVTISTGVFILTDPIGETAAVTIRGQSGMIRIYSMLGGVWQ